MIPEPTEADLTLDLERAWNCSAFVDPPEAMRQIIRRCHAAERERDDLRIREREVTCVWCGHQFKSTLQSQAQHLYEHAKVCEKHPVNAAESQLAALRAEVERLRAREAELVEGLKPFGMFAQEFDRYYRGDKSADWLVMVDGCHYGTLTITDLRRATALLKEHS